MKEFTAWAIDTQSPEGHGLLGRYFFAHNIPPSAEGCVTALWTTRREAREALHTAFGWTGSWKPRVIKVKVFIEKLT